MSTLSPLKQARQHLAARVRWARTPEEIAAARAAYDRVLVEDRIAQIAELAAVLTDEHRAQLANLASV